MYCSACGLEATIDVSYCKRCGNSLSQQATQQLTTFSLTGPSWAMAVTVMVLVGTIFSAVVKMAEMRISAVALTWMVIAGLGTVVALVAMIFKQMSKMVSVSQQKTQGTASQSLNTAELYQPRPGALPEHMPSVTENTTRAFEPAFREPVRREK